MRVQGEFGRARPHSQYAEPDHLTARLAQCVDNSLRKFVWLHYWHQSLFHLRTQLQIERPSRYHKNSTETATLDDFGQEGLANGA